MKLPYAGAGIALFYKNQKQECIQFYLVKEKTILKLEAKNE